MASGLDFGDLRIDLDGVRATVESEALDSVRSGSATHVVAPRAVGFAAEIRLEHIDAAICIGSIDDEIRRARSCARLVGGELRGASAGIGLCEAGAPLARDVPDHLE